MEPPAGATDDEPWLEHWEVLDKLDSGGQGETRRVRKKGSADTIGVLKTLVKKDDPKARRRMFQEVSNLRIVADSEGNVPNLLDDNSSSLSDPTVPLYFVMDFIEGLTLEKYVEQKGLLSPSDGLKLALALCKTIGIGHKAGVLHRDLKPGNLIVRDLRARDIVVLDYGLSFREEPRPQTELTDGEEPIGNSFTDLPERRTAGAQRRVESDVSAICGILYYSLTGHRPIPIRDPHGNPPHRQAGKALRDFCGDYEHLDPLEALLDRGLEHDFMDRFGTVDELTKRLQAVEAAPTRERVDITEYLQNASRRLSRKSRSALLQQFRKTSEPIMQVIARYVGTRCRSDMFAIHAQLLSRKDHVTRMPEVGLPEGLDDVVNAGVGLLIKPTAVDAWRVILYAVGSKGRQCVLLRRRLVPDLASSGRAPAFAIAGVAVGGPFLSVGAWDEVCWYQGTAVPSDEAIQSEVDDSVRWAVEGLIADLSDSSDGGNTTSGGEERTASS